MKVKELIEKLNKYPEDMEVLISDGYNFKFYRENDYAKWNITEFQGSVDIGISDTLIGE